MRRSNPLILACLWLGPASLAVQHKVEQATRKAAPWCKVRCCFTSLSAFSTCKEDFLPADFMSNVYLFSCECSHSYVGRTTLRLRERIKQHIPADGVNSVAPGNAMVKQGRGQPSKLQGVAIQSLLLPPELDLVSSHTRSKAATVSSLVSVQTDPVCACVCVCVCVCVKFTSRGQGIIA